MWAKLNKMNIYVQIKILMILNNFYKANIHEKIIRWSTMIRNIKYI